MSHSYSKERLQNLKKYVFDKLGNKCAKCGGNNNLQLDHIDPTYKHNMHSVWEMAEDHIDEELENCQLLCLSPCHVDKTLSEQGTKRITEHGRSMYVAKKCRCDICREANREYRRNYHQAWGT